MRTLCFHQKFPFERSLMKGFLHSIATNPTNSKTHIGAYLGVNPYKVSGIRGWFVKLGLGSGSAKQYHLSPFGAAVVEHDPDLVKPGTLWLLHYFLVSEHAERAEVWYRCFNEFIFPGRQFTYQELGAYVEVCLPEPPTNRQAVMYDAQELLKTYRSSAALGELRILTKQSDLAVMAKLPTLPDPMIAAYVLFNTWQRRYGAADTLRLSQIATDPEMLGRVFVATPTQVRELILRLQALGLVNYADTQHEPVTRRFSDPLETLLSRYYSQP